MCGVWALALAFGIVRVETEAPMGAQGRDDDELQHVDQVIREPLKHELPGSTRFENFRARR